MKNIGIVGSGIGGLHLALFLQQHGVAVTLYSDRTAEQLRTSKFYNTPARFGQTMDRERSVGINHWDDATPLTHFNLAITGTPLQFRAYVEESGMFIDPRIYTSTWLDDFETRGGTVVIGALTADDVVRLSEQHDLMVIASGKGSLIELFERLPQYSPFDAPQRLLIAGYFDGINKPDQQGMGFVISPGNGEVFQASVNTFDGVRESLLIEGIPGGGFDIATKIRYQDNPAEFNAQVLELLRVHAPSVYELVDPATFGVANDEVMQGAVTPTVRKGYKALSNGKFAVAMGDVHVSNDPIVGQGANNASTAAWTLGDLILNETSYDETFCANAEAKMWAYTESVTNWSNAFLMPPPDHVLNLLGAASQNQALANAFANNFNYPVRQWEVLSSPDNTMAFIQQHMTATQPV
ncbi:MAG: monooxygenase [Anaerolineae bacterium]|nr:monooxygenase [Anaerolineae bacterium]